MGIGKEGSVVTVTGGRKDETGRTASFEAMLAASRALTPARRVELASDVLRRAQRLRDDVHRDLETERFGADDIQMQAYSELAKNLAFLFPDDSALGRLILMPDAILQSFGTLLPAQSMANYLPARRLEARLNYLIDHLEGTLGEHPEDSTTQSASEVLAAGQTAETKEIRRALENLLAQKPKMPAIDERDFAFISEVDLRRVLVSDYVEAQRGFVAGAFKAASAMSGGIIEGMLIDALRRPEVVVSTSYEKATAKLRWGGEIDWSRVTLGGLIGAAKGLDLLSQSAQRLIDGARDFRNALHPLAECREEIRAGKEEAELLLAFIKLLYRDLGDA